jgi:hypothetical protein
MEYIVADVTHSHRTKPVGTGALSYDKKTRTVYLFSDDGAANGRCLGQLEGAMVTEMAAHGIWFVGYAPDGVDKHLRQRRVLTEWFCRYKEAAS